jgi:hypothetical protein
VCSELPSIVLPGAATRLPGITSLSLLGLDDVFSAATVLLWLEVRAAGPRRRGAGRVRLEARGGGVRSA